MKRTRFLSGFLPVLVLAVLVSGCVSAPGPHCARLAFNGWFCLLPPSALAPRNGTDLVTVTRDGKSERFVGQLSITSARLQLALTNLAGVPAATLTWDGIKAGIVAPKTKLDAERLTALLELTLAAPAELRPALHGLTLATSRTGLREERRLTSGTRLVARAVMMTSGVTHIEVPRVQLKITLKPLKHDADE
ncbi:MAG: DUF3261 domain-containing protein [Gammaproteobacteria bacterium]